MADAQQDTASEAARALAAKRWGNAAVVRAAETVIARARELDESTRAELHQATGPAGGDPGDQG
jgi:hypothetical protein